MLIDTPYNVEDEYGGMIEIVDKEKDKNENKSNDKNNDKNNNKDAKKDIKNVDDNNDKMKNKKLKNIWHLYIPFGATLSASLYFKPLKSNVYDFKLPLFIQGVIPVVPVFGG